MPKYLQLQQILIAQIKQDTYKIGDRLCTDTELKQRYSLSTSTVTRALYELERAGFVSRKQGSGTYIKSKKPKLLLANEPQTPVQLHPKTLLICGAQPDFQEIHENINWFIGHEIYRGLLEGFNGRVQIVLPDALPKKIDEALTASQTQLSQTCVALINQRPGFADILAKMRAHALAHIVIDQISQSPQVLPRVVGMDHRPGVREAMDYLIDDLGHRDIAFIGPEKDSLKIHHRARWAGYCNSLESRGLPLREELLVSSDGGSVQAGYRSARRLLERGVKFSALFATTDLKAFGVIQALQEAGLQIPRDVSVVGFDDIPGCAQNDPPLTTVRLPYYEAGLAASKLLHSQGKTDNTDEGKVLPSRLIKRASCAPFGGSVGFL